MEINYGTSNLVENPFQVRHDHTLEGKGTKESPLKVAGALAFTPTGNDDSTGIAGSIAYDDDYIYVKTASGWAASSLTLLDPTP